MLFKILEPLGAILSFVNYKRDRIHLSKLVSNGLKIGNNVYIGPSVIFDEGYPYLIEIGNNCRISSGTIILSHDASTFRDLGVTRISPVKILEGSFIGVNSIILPGVTIGPNAVIAAGSVVNRDIGEGKIAAGNPARPYGNYSELVQKYVETVQNSKIFTLHDIENGLVTPKDILEALHKKLALFVSEIPAYDPYYVNTDMDYMRKKAKDDVNDLIKGLDPKPYDE